MNRSLSDIFRSVHRFLTRLFAGRAPRIGVEISDQAVRAIFERKGAWQLEQVALPPGVVAKGTALNKEALLTALVELRGRIAGGSKRRIGVHVTLTSAPVYTQQVTIPPVSEAEMQSAVELNVQVSAPVPLAELAWGWQLLPGQSPPAVLAAWTDRAHADELVALLAQANFLPASLEPKVLSLARLVRALFPNGREGAFVLVSVDESGVTLSVLDAGIVRFQYARSWEEVRGVAADITYPMLETLLRREVPQVAGFYAQRGGAPLKEVLLATPTYPDEITKTLTDLGFTVRALKDSTPDLPLQGYGAYGAALRGGIFTTQDEADLSLLGGQVLAWLRKELVVRVAGFWTLATPAAFAILLATYGGAYVFVQRVNAAAQAAATQVSPQLLAELGDREKQAESFNSTVATLAKVQTTILPRSPVLDRLLTKAQQNGVIVNHVALTNAASSISGVAGGDSQLLSFKRALESDPALSQVALPIANLRTGPDGISFSMSFSVDYSAKVATSTNP